MFRCSRSKQPFGFACRLLYLLASKIARPAARHGHFLPFPLSSLSLSLFDSSVIREFRGPVSVSAYNRTRLRDTVTKLIHRRYNTAAVDSFAPGRRAAKDWRAGNAHQRKKRHVVETSCNGVCAVKTARG